MKKPDADRYLARLHRSANAGRRRKGKPATAAQLAAMNIKTEGG